MTDRAIETSDFQEISHLALGTVQGGSKLTPFRKAGEWVTAKFAQLLRKNVEEITPRPRNKDFIDNAIRRPVEPAPGTKLPGHANDNFPPGSP